MGHRAVKGLAGGMLCFKWPYMVSRAAARNAAPDKKIRNKEGLSCFILNLRRVLHAATAPDDAGCETHLKSCFWRRFDSKGELLSF